MAHSPESGKPRDHPGAYRGTAELERPFATAELPIAGTPAPRLCAKSAARILANLKQLCMRTGHCRHYRAFGSGVWMTTSTRRFCCRPENEALVATGDVSPIPAAVSLSGEIPCPIRYDMTELALRSDRA